MNTIHIEVNDNLMRCVITADRIEMVKEEFENEKQNEGHEIESGEKPEEKSRVKRSFFFKKKKISPAESGPESGVTSGPFEAREASEEPSTFKIEWNNLSYTVIKSNFCSRKRRTRKILRSLNGYFKSGQLTALMGPSGAGKSTLLSCVCGYRTTGMTGDIKINGINKIKVSIIDQDDYLFDRLTVREAMVFASKVKNSSKTRLEHKVIIKNIINILKIESCLDTPLGRCSGGQRKRISIALELVSKPNILVLDEPTSGLDSVTAYNTVKVLQELTQQKEPMAIIATIHQPSSRVFYMFNHVYVLSKSGQCIYQGSSTGLLNTLSRVGLECPAFHNPADFIAEIASGLYEQEAVHKLIQYHKNEQVYDIDDGMNKSSNVIDSSFRPRFPFFYHLYLLTKRNLMILPREPQLSYIKLFTQIINGILVGVLFGSETGRVNGCLPSKNELYMTRPEILYHKYMDQQLQAIKDNLGFIFFVLLFLMYTGMLPTILVFPKEFNAFKKEYTNGWYSVMTYFLAKFISELPAQLILPQIFISLSYYLSEQIQELWRFAYFSCYGLCITLIGQNVGIIISVLLSRNLVQIAFTSIMITVPMMIFCGYFKRYYLMSWYLQPFAFISFVKYGFEGILVTIYGFERCQDYESNFNKTIPEPVWLKLIKTAEKKDKFEDYDFEEEGSFEKLMTLISTGFNRTKINQYSNSLILTDFQLTDDLLQFNLILLSIYIISTIIIGYIIMLYKVNHKK